MSVLDGWFGASLIGTMKSPQQISIHIHVQLNLQLHGKLQDINGSINLIVKEKTTNQNVKEHPITFQT